MANNTTKDFTTSYKVFMVAFCDAYSNLETAYAENGSLAFRDVDGNETAVYLAYQKMLSVAIYYMMFGKKELTSNQDVKMNSNRSKVEGLHTFAEYAYVGDDDTEIYRYELDPVHNDLLHEILRLEDKDHRFLNLHNAEYAYNSMNLKVGFLLSDMLRKVKKNNTSLDTPIYGEDGSEMSLSDSLPDVSQHPDEDTEFQCQLEDAKTILVHENIRIFIQNNKPENLLGFLNSLCFYQNGTGIVQRTNGQLLADIHNSGYQYAIWQLAEILKREGIYIDYLAEYSFTWKKEPVEVTKGDIEHWKSRAMADVRKSLAKRGISL